MSNRPSFQFYPADWQANKNLRRCSFRHRGIWLEVMCLMNDSDEYGILKWSPEDIASAVGCEISDLQVLIDKGILKGCDKDTLFTGYKATFSQRNKPPKEVILIQPQQGPLWYSSRMVRDEYKRNERAKSGYKSQENPNVPKKKDDKPEAEKDTFSPSPSSSSTSSSSNNNKKKKKKKFNPIEFSERLKKWKTTTSTFELSAYESLEKYCREMGIENRVNPELYFINCDEFKTKFQTWPVVKTCINWLKQEDMKFVTSMRIRKFFDNQKTWNKGAELKKLTEKKDNEFKQKSPKIGPVWTPPKDEMEDVQQELTDICPPDPVFEDQIY